MRAPLLYTILLFLMPPKHAVASKCAMVLGKDYIALDLEFAPIETLRRQVEAHIGRALVHRGEAHITIISPPEHRVLTQLFSASEIANQMKLALAQQNALIEATCIGKGEAMIDGQLAQTYFIVVKAEALFEFRQGLEREFRRRGGDSNAFRAARFFPHITLGFTKRDLHETDGVVKDGGSCFLTL